MSKKLLILMVLSHGLYAHNIAYPEKQCHEEKPTALYDRVIIELKEGNIYKTAIISCFVASFISLLYVHYFQHKTFPNIIIQPYDHQGNTANVGMKFLE